ncbi:MAG: long-chain fatty acid--CoA ligase [Rhodococcus sp. (in: high G+C Gram-positive bacteria)]|nr:MAG: long-chain fatty acid--CoA ligase [Rhodococcus sp. (in: high G+C Gram-positive bacteria)]
MLNLSVMLTDSARDRPDQTAVVEGDRSMTYREVDDAANRVAALLVDSGINAGDRVAMSCPNILEFPVVYYGILKAGAVVVPLNTMLRRSEVAYHLTDSGARGYFHTSTDSVDEAWRGFEDADSCEYLFPIADLAALVAKYPAEEVLVPTEATDTAVVLYTSGTTGKPKGAELTHANLVVNAHVCHRLFQVLDGIQLVTLPLFHSFGQTVQLNAGFGQGGTLVLLPRFDAAKTLDLMIKQKVTVFAGVPTMYWALLSEVSQREDAIDLGSMLKLAISGGAALPVEVLNRFQEVFGVGIREGYGLSETSPVVTFNRLDRPSRPGSIGMPVWGVELDLRSADGKPAAPGESGELVVRGHNVMKGYLGRPDATAEAIDEQGWFRTGDIANRDEDGFYYVVDRAKDLIVRGGFNVYPREVEEALMAHPGVSLVAVVGVPDDRVGEEVKAFVIPQPGATITEEDLVAWSREHLAVYKCPRVVEFRDSLPMNATGKLLKRELR